MKAKNYLLVFLLSFVISFIILTIPFIITGSIIDGFWLFIVVGFAFGIAIIITEVVNELVGYF